MNKKEAKVLRLWNDGCDVRLIAKRIGYDGNAITAGIEKVRKVLIANGIKI